MTARPPAALLVAGLLVAAAGPAAAEYALRDLEEVPVERLLETCERRLEAEPDDAQAHYVLARLSALAYHLRRTALKARVYAGEGGRLRFQTPYALEGGDPAATGGAGARRDDVPPDEAEAISGYLDRAIEHYRAATRLAPEDAKSHLGLAWCLEQAEEPAEAAREYRRAFEAAREAGDSYVAEEAGHMLIRLLEAEGGRGEEVEALREAIAALPPYPITPIVVPLDDGAGFADLLGDRAVRFDLRGHGEPRRWRWVSPRAGLLCWDPAGTGRVTSGRQLFGTRTFWVFWDHGYAALAALDDDRDGWLAGAELSGLALWRDADQDGVSDRGEVRPLAAWGVAGLAVRPSEPPRGGPRGWSHPSGVRLADGRRRASYDWLAEPAGE